MKAINLEQKFSLFSDQWSPKVVGEMNGQYVKLAKIEGEFIWHTHENEDELFYITKGDLTLKFRDGEVRLKAGDMYIVPKGVEHLPIAHEETWVLLIEPKSTAHTGEVESDVTVAIEDQTWI